MAQYLGELIDLRPILLGPINCFPPNRVSLSQFVDFGTFREHRCLPDNVRPIQILVGILDSGEIERNNRLRENGQLSGRINC